MIYSPPLFQTKNFAPLLAVTRASDMPSRQIIETIKDVATDRSNPDTGMSDFS
jgi:hypothetical protein